MDQAEVKFGEWIEKGFNLYKEYAYPFDSRRGFGYLGSMVRPTFPRTLREFRERFANEEACFEYLAQ
ncbi:MAG: hypothetical protein ABIL06_16680, partial [Pseudomonadota bacterium]